MTRLLALVIAFLTLLIPVSAQQKGKQHKLTGKVTEVSKTALTVDHGSVEGFMGAMTMPYGIDKPETLLKYKAGDLIEATVYENDYTLYDIKIVPPTAKAAEKAKK
ncbi:MAG: copper-binding protein [Bryobacteraceae bacterium]